MSKRGRHVSTRNTFSLNWDQRRSNEFYSSTTKWYWHSRLMPHSIEKSCKQNRSTAGIIFKVSLSSSRKHLQQRLSMLILHSWLDVYLDFIKADSCRNEACLWQLTSWTSHELIMSQTISEHIHLDIISSQHVL